MHLNFVVGTAAELIKVYPVIHAAVARGHSVRVVSTGQSHENFLMQYRDFNLPRYALTYLLESSGDLERARAALRWFSRAVLVTPRQFCSRLTLGGSGGFVVVHGDTLSTLVGAWLARRAHLPVVHIEAGLRSTSLFNPFPEEITRRLVSHFAKFHMSPDTRGVKNLREARVAGQVVCTQGNTLLDAVVLSVEEEGWQPGGQPPFALVNIHRFENLNSSVRWRQIVETVVKAAAKTKLIFILHPQTRHKVAQDRVARERLRQAGVEMHDRMPFSEFISLLKRSQYLITDGGSNQEECSYLGKPCLLLREATERQEGLGTCCVLSRFAPATIDNFLEDPSRFKVPPLEVKQSPTTLILDTLEKYGTIL